MLSVIYMIYKPETPYSATNAYSIPSFSNMLTPLAVLANPSVSILSTSYGFYGSVNSMIFKPVTVS